MAHRTGNLYCKRYSDLSSSLCDRCIEFTNSNILYNMVVIQRPHMGNKNG